MSPSHNTESGAQPNDPPRLPTRVFDDPATSARTGQRAPAIPVLRTPHREAPGHRLTIRLSAPRVDQHRRIPVAVATSFLLWEPGEVHSRVEGASVIVTRHPQPLAVPSVIDGRARLIIPTGGRGKVFISSGDPMLVIAVAATDTEPDHLVVSALSTVAYAYLASREQGRA